MRQTAGLLPGVLLELRADALLTADARGALPLDVGHFPPGSMFRPLFDSVREALTAGELMPVAGGYRAAAELMLARGAGLDDFSAPISSVRSSMPGARSTSPIGPSRRTAPPPLAVPAGRARRQ